MQLEVATSSGWRIQEQTQRERAFTRRLNKLINQADKLDDREVRKMMSMLRRTRERVAAAILDAEGFDMIHFARIEAAINTAFEELSAQYIAQSNGYLDNAWRFGAKMVDEPLDVAGLGMQLTAVPQVSIQQLEVLQGFSADLIGGLMDDAKGKINREIQLGIMGKQTPHQVMQGVGKNLADPSTFRTIKARAEAITRTELNRVVNLGAQRRLKQVSEQIPEMKKYWMANIDGRERQAHGAVARRTNPNLGGVPIGVDEDFIVGGEKAQGPHDPRLTAKNTVQCRCRLGYVLPEVQT